MNENTEKVLASLDGFRMSDEMTYSAYSALYDEISLLDDLLKAQDVSDTNTGKWTTHRTQEHDGEWYCSECGYEPVVMSDDMKYCPGCGRKMTMPEPPKEET